MPLARDSDQLMYAQAVDGFLGGLSEREIVRRLIIEDHPPPRSAVTETWATFAKKLRVAGLPIAESLGGEGGSWSEVGVVLEATGRYISAVPYLTVMTAVRILETTQSAAGNELLTEISDGQTRVVLAIDSSAFYDNVSAACPDVRIDDGAVTGTVCTVLDGAHADVFICPVRDVDAVRLVAVEASHALVMPIPAIDLTRGFARVTFESAPYRVLECSGLQTALGDALAFAAAAIAMESVGGAGRCLELTVEYVKNREQFGQPVGQFQAVKHMLADVVRVIEPAKAAAYAAIEAAAARETDLPHLASVAKLSAVEAYAAAAGAAIQLHGAIGFTWELGLHLHFKRAMTCRSLFGTSKEHRRSLARDLLQRTAHARDELKAAS